MTTKEKARDGDDRASQQGKTSNRHSIPLDPLQECGAEMKAPIVTGQCAEVLTLIRHHQPLLSFVLTADHAIPEAAARVHDLRGRGFNVITRIVPTVEFRGRIRRNAALYSLGTPEWPYPGFVTGEEGGGNDE